MHKHLLRLTPLRFVAALFVVIFHYGGGVPPFDAPWSLPLAESGSQAVSFFFCLSGFIMATVYGGSHVSAREYWMARIARIYPVYLLCAVITYLFNHGSFKAIILQLSLLQSWVPHYPLTINAPGWSLSVEAFFYAIFPLLIVRFYRLGIARVTVAVGLFWILTQFIVSYCHSHFYGGYPSISHDLLFYFPLMHLSEFLVGMLASMAFSRVSQRVSETHRFGIGIIVFLSGIGLTSLVSEVASLFQFAIVVEDGYIVPIFAGIIWLVASLPTAWSWPLESRLLVTLGEASYALYLLQYPARLFFDRFIFPRFTAMGQTSHFYFFVAMLVVISVLVYRYFERPLRSLVRRRANLAGRGLASDHRRSPSGESLSVDSR